MFSPLSEVKQNARILKDMALSFLERMFCCLMHLKHSSQEQSLCRCRPSFPQIQAAWSAGVIRSLLTSVYGASQPRGKPLGVKLQVESIQEAAYSSTSSCQRTLNKLGGGKMSKPILCAVYLVCEINT